MVEEMPGCPDEVCVTCSDVATPGTVLRLLDDNLAVVRTGAGQEQAGQEQEVSVALVTVRVGDTVLVHAGEAIAVLPSGAT